MLRSLVGSEMCIRDRVGKLHEVNAEVDIRRYAETVESGVTDVKIWRATPCLLYTSDAADDLLCVDLGGRRIIKKKTQ